MSDIRLDDDNGTSITLDADLVRATASDFLLDNAARHTKPHTSSGCALLFTVKRLTPYDPITASDYPGGVTINDVVAIHSRGGISISNVKEVSGVKLSEFRSSDGGRTARASGSTGGSCIRQPILREPRDDRDRSRAEKCGGDFLRR